jgi:hypothetical protein
MANVFFILLGLKKKPIHAHRLALPRTPIHHRILARDEPHPQEQEHITINRYPNSAYAKSMCVQAPWQPPFSRTSHAQRVHTERTALAHRMHTDLGGDAHRLCTVFGRSLHTKQAKKTSLTRTGSNYSFNRTSASRAPVVINPSRAPLAKFRNTSRASGVAAFSRISSAR